MTNSLARDSIIDLTEIEEAPIVTIEDTQKFTFKNGALKLTYNRFASQRREEYLTFEEIIGPVFILDFIQPHLNHGRLMTSKRSSYQLTASTKLGSSPNSTASPKSLLSDTGSAPKASPGPVPIRGTRT